MMLEAGNDARIKNKANLTPAQLCDPLLKGIKEQLEEAVWVEMERGDFVDADEGVEEGDAGEDEVGSQSGSDFEKEELDQRNGKAV